MAGRWSPWVCALTFTEPHQAKADPIHMFCVSSKHVAEDVGHLCLCLLRGEAQTSVPSFYSSCSLLNRIKCQYVSQGAISSKIQILVIINCYFCRLKIKYISPVRFVHLIFKYMALTRTLTTGEVCDMENWGGT